jgi:hypothetical protein
MTGTFNPDPLFVVNIVQFVGLVERMAFKRLALRLAPAHAEV